MLTGTNLSTAKRHNLQIVHETIRLYTPISRADVARRTGLTAQTISNLVRQLVDAGLVVETRRASGGRGAPPIQLEVNPDAAFAVGLDFDVDHVTAVLVDLAGAVRQRIHHEVTLPSPGEALDLLDGAVRQLLDLEQIGLDQIWGVGVGVPGPMVPSGDGTYVVSPTAFPEWHDVPLAEQLHGRLGLPIFIENNATAAAVGEHWYGAGQHLSTFFYVYLGSGLGGGLVVQGAPFEGHTGNAGEIGYLPPLRATASGVGDHVGELFNLGRLYDRLRAAGAPATGLNDLVRLHGEKDPAFEAWFGEAAETLAGIIRMVGHLLDPEATFIGGRWPAALLRDLLQQVTEHLAAGRPIGRPGGSELRLAAAGADAAALGVATLPLYSAFAPTPRIDLKRADSGDGGLHGSGAAFRRVGVVQ